MQILKKAPAIEHLPEQMGLLAHHLLEKKARGLTQIGIHHVEVPRLIDGLPHTAAAAMKLDRAAAANSLCAARSDQIDVVLLIDSALMARLPLPVNQLGQGPA